VDGCLKVLKSVVDKNYVAEITKSTLTLFLQREKNGSR
jgi:hypothetical protein